MVNPNLSRLLQDLEKKATHKASLTELNVAVSQEDLIRLEALADVFEMEQSELFTALLHTVLQEVEAAMPYRPGNKVIRVEDGDPIYEDIGPMPRYLARRKQLEERYRRAKASAN